MRMQGIDVSNWQSGLDLSKIKVDFVICKATEGLNFTDKQCDKFITAAKSKGILWGFYHFARSNDPAKEAEHFYNSTKDYIGSGIPILDYEVYGQNPNDVTWCEKFIQRFHELSNIWCLLYTSAYYVKNFAGSWIPDKCGLWLAGYPKKYTSWPDNPMPYSVSPWRSAAIWQFTDSLRLQGFSGNLDGDLAYMDASAWKKYAKTAGGTVSTPPMPDYEQLADEVIAGKWGNGQARQNALDDKYGKGTYKAVQAIVNTRLGSKPDYEKLADEVIAGKWGNGWNRMNALNSTYGTGTYEKVQEIVNRRLK